MKLRASNSMKCEISEFWFKVADLPSVKQLLFTEKLSAESGLSCEQLSVRLFSNFSLIYLRFCDFSFHLKASTARGVLSKTSSCLKKSAKVSVG